MRFILLLLLLSLKGKKSLVTEHNFTCGCHFPPSWFCHQMREAADDDRQLNAQRQPATKKMSMLPLAMSQINKTNLIEGFLDANILSALTDWLAPMPDRSLPAARIRESIINWLLQVHEVALLCSSCTGHVELDV